MIIEDLQALKKALQLLCQFPEFAFLPSSFPLAVDNADCNNWQDFEGCARLSPARKERRQDRKR
jgi:hypothetical protein